MRRWVWIALALVPGGVVIAQTPAPEPAATSTPNTEVQRRLAEITEAIARAGDKQAALLDGIAELELEIAGRRDELASIEAEITREKADSEAARAKFEALSARIAGKREWLKGRMRSVYIHGRPGYLKVLFAAESYADLVRRTKFNRILAKRDSELVAEMKTEMAVISEARVEMEQEVDSLERALNDSRAANEALTLEGDLRRTLLDKVKSEAAGFEGIKKKLEAEQASMGTTIAALPSTAAARPFADVKGRLLPPLTGGRLKLGFGPYMHPTLGLPMKHQGIAWTCDPGESVRAVYGGKVEMADWFSTYGRVVVIDHGDGWRTIYAHNSELSKKKGDIVEEGDVIAKTGDTGSFEGAFLFFGLYRNGEPVDPAEWFVKK